MSDLGRERAYTICLTFDFDALSVWLGGYPSVTPAMLSRGEYGARVGLPRILKLLAAYGIPATFFVPGRTVESFPSAVEMILSAGHEVAHHGYGHEDPSTQSPDEERCSLERGLAVLERFLGNPPLGYRSPSWDYSATTLYLLVEYGFLYDSSLFAADFHPYHPRLDRHRVPGDFERQKLPAVAQQLEVCKRTRTMHVNFKRPGVFLAGDGLTHLVEGHADFHRWGFVRSDLDACGQEQHADH